MKGLAFNILKGFRKLHRMMFGSRKKSFFTTRAPDFSGEEASQLIYDRLMHDEPCMIARFGSVELDCIRFYKIHSQSRMHRYRQFVVGEINALDWPESVTSTMGNNAGFFPVTPELLSKFSEMMLQETKNLDILGSWLENENKLATELEEVQTVRLKDLKPFVHSNPWTKALKGKKVLVIHPFTESIEAQYQKRELVFTDQNLLPEFDLITYKPVQSIAGNHEAYPYKDWFEALEFMRRDLEKIDFDIAILGCGAYGFPLASFIKSLGKKSVHLGGVTQILFGIIGKRWEEEFDLSHLINEHWVRPSISERPANFRKVEDGCYW
ncbi:MAG: hypothetical protein AAF489_12350 [Bacteroidota bacterium]